MKRRLVAIFGRSSDSRIAGAPEGGTFFTPSRSGVVLGFSVLLLSTQACSEDSSAGDGDGDLVGDGDGDLVGDGDGDLFCTDQYVYGLSVVVLGGADEPASGEAPGLVPVPIGGAPNAGGASGVDECAATVVAVDGDYRETLQCFVQGRDCQCFGAGERAGEYSVTATWGDQAETQRATVTGGDCHVSGVSLTFFEEEQ